jgi:uncharacterized protein DUF4402
MGRSVSIALAFAALAAAAAGAGAWPAAGQCRLCDKPSTQAQTLDEKRALSLQVETGLSFERLVVDGTGEGSVTVRPDGSSVAQGSVQDAGPRVMIGSATVRGEPGRAIRVELPRQIILYSTSGGQIVLDQVVSDLPSIPRLDSAGRLSFRFGGRLHVRGDTEGSFRGDLPITADYL